MNPQKSGAVTPHKYQDIADRYAGAACTLNGRPARIVGRVWGFATVAQVPNGASAQWSWPSVERVMEHGRGEFRS